MLDDWFLLRNAELDGWWQAAGRDAALARPGSGVVYALTFGLLGHSAIAHWLVATALTAVTAVLIRAALERHEVPHATWVAAAWIVLPNHQSLTHWPTGIALLAALALVAAGATVENEWQAAALLAASVLTYEATAPLAVAIVVFGRRRLLPGVPVLAAAGVWIAVFFHPAKSNAIDRWADLRQLPNAHLGWGVFPDGPLSTVIAALAIVGIGVAVVLRRDRTIVIGLAVIALGTLPFLRYFYAPLGAGDRVNVVAGVGTALVWVGLLRYAVPLAPVLLVPALLAADQGDRAWARAADEAAAIERTLATTTGNDLLVGPPPRLERNVASFLDHSNIEGAAQLARRDRTVRARLATLPAIQDADPENRVRLP